MHEYWAEFLALAGFHLAAVASPGPDFAIVLKQALAHGRRAALVTSFGIGAAILLHVTYSVLGLGLLIRGSAWWFALVKYAGAGYLAWLGVQALRSRPRTEGGQGAEAPAAPSGRSAFFTGFLTNALNPKVALFFISLFVLVVKPTTPKAVQAAYGVWMAAATAAWFCLVSLLFTQPSVRRKFLRYGHWIDRVLGVALLAFAASLIFAEFRPGM